MVRRIKITEEELIQLLSNREEKGIEILYDNYSAALYGVIHRIVQQDEIAEDVLQETFLKIWNNFGQYDSAKGRLFSWMINIARNASIDKVRSKEFVNRNKNQNLEKAVFSAGEDLQSGFNPETIGIKKMVQELEPEYRQVIELLFFGGYSQSAAAEKLNIPLGTVKTRSRAALQKLKNYFERT
ncbi:MAG: sigma-70 family RNA polymerase sigma factor [Bacteroidia bacterium]